MKILKIYLLSLLLLACSKNAINSQAEENPQLTEDQMIAKADYLYDKGKFRAAAKTYSDLTLEYPFSKYAQEAVIREGEAYYSVHDFDQAISAFDEYIVSFAGHDKMAYVNYMRVLCFYNRLSDPLLDNNLLKEALQEINNFLSSYGDSKYARDIEYKRRYLNEFAAYKELYIANFYYKRKKYAAALNRYLTIYNSYNKSSYIEEALFRITEILVTIGSNNEAQKYASILGNNYPASPWYFKAYSLVQ